MKDAYARYYAKHRDALVARMRERDARRREALAAAIEGDPSVAEAVKAKAHEKYLRSKEGQSLSLLRQTAEKPTVRPLAKAFIQDELIKTETFKALSLSTVKALCSALETA